MSIKRIINYLKAEIGIAPLVFAILMYATCIGIQLWPTSTVAYMAMCAFVVYALTRGGGLEPLCLAFIAYLPIELMLANPPSLFNCWQRMPLLAVVFTCFSPMVKSATIRNFRHNVMMGFSIISVFVAVSSFVCYFIGINMMRSFEGDILLNETGGSFGGITWHSMTLAPLSAAASVFLSHMALTRKKKIFWLLDVMAIGSLFFASSRSALLAMIAGQIVVFYYQSSNRSVFLKRLLLVIGLMAITYPLWKAGLSGFEAKNAASIEQSGDIFSTRAGKWSSRIEEFQSSPIWGIGIPSVSLDDTHSYTMSGIIEPGSSWLSILSMTGLIGAFFLFPLFWSAVKNSIHSKSPRRQVYLGTLVVFMVHLFAEGYIFSGGSFLCVYFWASVGACYDLKYFNNE